MSIRSATEGRNGDKTGGGSNDGGRRWGLWLHKLQWLWRRRGELLAIVVRCKKARCGCLRGGEVQMIADAHRSPRGPLLLISWRITWLERRTKLSVPAKDLKGIIGLVRGGLARPDGNRCAVECSLEAVQHLLPRQQL